MAAILYLKFLEFLATSCLPCFQHRGTFKPDSLPVETASDFTNVYAYHLRRALMHNFKIIGGRQSD